MRRRSCFILSIVCLTVVSGLMSGCVKISRPTTANTAGAGPKPVISSFTASPQAISQGGSSTLGWNVSGATQVSIDQGVGNITLIGNRPVSPGSTTVYKLTASNASGSVTATAQVTVSGTTTTQTTVTGTTPTQAAISGTTPTPVTPSNLNWVGGWDTSFGATCLIQSGNQVIGVYEHDEGKIEGTLSGNVLRGRWSEAPTYSSNTDSGEVELTISGDSNLFTGHWRYGNTGSGWQGEWNGTRTSATCAPVINSFIASPTSITSGGSSTLTWSVLNAASVSISPSVGTVAVAGSTAVSPAVTTSYTLTATNASGSVTATVQVMVSGVTPAPIGLPVISSFTAYPTSVTAGSPVALSWIVSNADSVTISPTIGAVPTAGSGTVYLASTTSFVLTATNSYGSATATVQIVVSAATPAPTPTALPVVNSFTASPTSITIGDSATLAWSVSNAASVSISPAVGTVAATGSVSVSPNTITVYTLTATNTAGSVTATVQVVVNAAPPSAPVGNPPIIQTFEREYYPICAGQSAVLWWSVDNAVSVEIEPNVGAVSPQGMKYVSPSTTTTYTLTATNPYGSRQETELIIVCSPGEDSCHHPDGSVGMMFHAFPSKVHAGESTVLNWCVTGGSVDIGFNEPNPDNFNLREFHKIASGGSSGTLTVIPPDPITDYYLMIDGNKYRMTHCRIFVSP